MYCFAKRIACALSALAAVPAAHAAVCRVTTAGLDTNSGAAWNSPYDLQSALADTNCTEIWVAAGTYKPTAGTDRTISFNIRPGIAVYGGFAGSESARTARDPAANFTTLSGDIGAAGDADNSFHVVAMNGTTAAGSIEASTVLDGFTIAGGHADPSYDAGDAFGPSGGGLYCDGHGTGKVCSPTLANLVFSGNSAATAGGAVYDDGSFGGVSSPSMTNISFSDNSAMGSLGGGAIFNFSSSGTSSPTLTDVAFSGNDANFGGAMFNDGAGGSSSPTLTRVTFSGNSAHYGGAMYDYASTYGTSSPLLTDVTFDGNSATGSGGAISTYAGDGGTSSPALAGVTFSGNSAVTDGGAMYDYAEYGGTLNPTLVNVTFAGNDASGNGGAMYNQETWTATISPVLTNVTFSGNHAHAGGAMYNAGEITGTFNPVLTNVILWGDSLTGTGGSGPEIFNDTATPVVDHGIVQGGCPAGSTCTSIHTGNPLLGALADNGGLTPTMLPGAGGAAIDAGDDNQCPATDQRGVARPQGAHCDIGAVEVVTDRIFTDNFDGRPTP
jgi:predicted outer membrane repeat protein